MQGCVKLQPNSVALVYCEDLVKERDYSTEIQLQDKY